MIRLRAPRASASRRRAGAVLLCAVALLVGTAARADADVRPTLAPEESLSIASQAAGWLAGSVLGPDGAARDAQGRPDPVTTAWSALALRAAGLETEAEAPAGWLQRDVDALARLGGQESPAGLAMLILVARAQNLPAESFGGQDLVARLLATRGPDGLFGSLSGPQRVADPLGGVPARQGLVLSALGAAGQTDAAAAEWIEQRECPQGGWQFDRISPQAPCTPDPVTTGYVMQGLAAVGREVPGSAVRALGALQNPDGGFPLFPGITDSMATALGLQGLIAAGEDPNTDRWRKGQEPDVTGPFGALLRFSTDVSAGFSSVPGQPPNASLTSRVVIAAAGQPLPLAAVDPDAQQGDRYEDDGSSDGGGSDGSGSGDDASPTTTSSGGDAFSPAVLFGLGAGALAVVGVIYAYRRRRQSV